MYRYTVHVLIILLSIFSVGCHSSSSEGTEIKKHDVNQTTAEAKQDDFIFRLISEKKQYSVGEEVRLYGEIEYVGDKEEVTIRHASSAILFPMEETVRGYKISFAVNDIGLSTTIKKGVPYREAYKKSGGYSSDQDPEEFVIFMKDFQNRDDFPPGYYVVYGMTDFSVETLESEEEQKRYNIDANIGFMVLD